MTYQIFPKIKWKICLSNQKNVLSSSNESNLFGYTIKDLTFDNFDQEYFLISLYSNKNYDIPLNLIPHKYRNIGFFREAAQKEIN